MPLQRGADGIHSFNFNYRFIFDLRNKKEIAAQVPSLAAKSFSPIGANRLSAVPLFFYYTPPGADLSTKISGQNVNKCVFRVYNETELERNICETGLSYYHYKKR